MKVKVIKTENPKFSIENQEIEVNLENAKVGDKVKLYGEILTITQTGEIFTLIGYRNNEPILYVLQRIYENKDYITDYKQIKEPDDLIVNENEKLLVIKTPMSLEALYKYLRYYKPTREPVIRIIGDDYYEFINEWRLYSSESHKNIKAGKYTYESKAVNMTVDEFTKLMGE